MEWGRDDGSTGICEVGVEEGFFWWMPKKSSRTAVEDDEGWVTLEFKPCNLKPFMEGTLLPYGPKYYWMSKVEAAYM